MNELLKKANNGLNRYGRHLYHECLYRFVYDRKNPDGSYDGSGHWEHRGAIKECECGLAQLLLELESALKSL